MDTELQELKSVLRSLVVSSPTQVDVRALLRDYRNMMGVPVPLAKYGYRDPVTFLRERFSDCFVFQGPQNNPVLTLIVPDALKHIDKFVQRQKPSTNVKFKEKRRSIPEQIINKSTKNLIASTFIPPPKNKQYNTTTPKLTTNTATNKNYTPESGNIPLHKSINKLNIQDQALSQESIASNKEKSQDNSAEERLQDLNSSQSALQKFLKKRLPFYNSSQHLSSDKYDSGIASSKGDDDSGRRTSSSTGSKAALLEELKKEIRDLVEEHPEGVWCTDLIALYRQRYKRELEFERFGLTSVAALAVGVGGVHVSRAGDGWLLSAAPAPPRRHVPLSVARYAPAAPEQVDPDDALPGIDFDPDVFPQDCMHFMESIPAAPLGALAPGANVGVMLGEVYSPSHFWLLRLGDGYDAMGDMMDEMTRYYTHGEGKDRSLALGAVRVGHYCSSVFEGDWHRSLIVRVQDCDTVKVGARVRSSRRVFPFYTWPERTHRKLLVYIL
ncbi:uncharacterized protein LOC135080288 [Ostrinia nubilalis]|uniref:uncharacterized protein LOC135080288 n=1 Tax=Ostrinia nubilalis TaxID=29057 RepID=UPI0030825919